MYLKKVSISEKQIGLFFSFIFLLSFSAFGRLFLSKMSFEMTTLPFKISVIPGTGLAQYFGCSVPKKKTKKQKLFDVRSAEQWSAEAQTTRSRAVEPGPSSPSPEKRQTSRAANGHRVPKTFCSSL